MVHLSCIGSHSCCYLVMTKFHSNSRRMTLTGNCLSCNSPYSPNFLVMTKWISLFWVKTWFTCLVWDGYEGVMAGPLPRLCSSGLPSQSALSIHQSLSHD